MPTLSILITLSRALERVAIVGAGGWCIWLGYKLFEAVPIAESSGSGQFGDVTLSLTKVGPGVFFAAFGTVLLWRCLGAAVLISPAEEELSKTGVRKGAILFGTSVEGSATDPVRLKNDIAVLNAMAERPTGLDPTDVSRATHKAKVALLAQAWDPGWGGDEVFRDLEEGRVPSAGSIADLYHAHLDPVFLSNVKG